MKRYPFKALLTVAVAAFLSVACFAAPKPVVDTDTALDFQKAETELSDIVLRGAGTAASPYLVSNADEYFEFCARVNSGENGAYCRLTEDIDFNGAVLTPIGNTSEGYCGTFDGNGFTINNFTISGTGYVGVFGFANNAVIKNLYVGRFDADLKNTTGEKVYVGIVADARDSTISRVCVNNSSLSLEGQTKYVYAGGICGHALSISNGTMLIEDCKNICDITLVNPDGYAYVGGIAGKFDISSGGVSLINRCFNVGSVSGNSYNSSNVGGLVGYLYSYGSAYSPESTALSADADVMIKNSFSAANVCAESQNYARVGKIAGNINAYAACDNATVLYTNDLSVTIEGEYIENTIGTAVALENFHSQTYLASKLGFDFTSVWSMPDSQVTYKYPVYKGTEKSVYADAEMDFFAVSNDISFYSNGHVVRIDKLRIAQGNRVAFDRGTYIIGEIEGVPNVKANINANVIIGGDNKPQNYAELDIGNAASGNIRYAEVKGRQFQIFADGAKYGLVTDDKIMVEIVEKVGTDTAYGNSKYFLAVPGDACSELEEISGFMNSTDTYGIRLSTEKMGIRFMAKTNIEKRDAESSRVEIAEYGYILTLKRHLDSVYDAQLNFDFEKYVAGVTYNAKDGTNIVFYYDDNNVETFCAVLYNIPTKGYKDDVVAKTYIKLVADGQEYIVYGEELVSNLYEVASSVDYESLNDEQKQILNSVLQS